MTRLDFQCSAITCKNKRCPVPKPAGNHVDFKCRFLADLTVFERENTNKFVPASFEAVCDLIQNLGAKPAIVFPFGEPERSVGGFDCGSRVLTAGIGIRSDLCSRSRVEALRALLCIDPLTVHPVQRCARQDQRIREIRIYCCCVHVDLPKICCYQSHALVASAVPTLSY